MEEALILAVEGNPILYDKSLAAFKDSLIKNDIWNDIGFELGITGELARKKWTNMRDSFLKNRKRIKESRSGDGAYSSSTHKYKYSDTMEFLVPHIHHRETSSNLDLVSDVDTIEEAKQDESEQNVKTSLYSEGQASSSSGTSTTYSSTSTTSSGTSATVKSSSPSLKPSKKAKKSQLEDVILQYFNTIGSDDKVDPFFISVSKSISKLPAVMQAEVKFKIYQLIHEYEMKYLSSEH
nr:transcription factor Adf-1-like [Lytechinus pictus]